MVLNEHTNSLVVELSFCRASFLGEHADPTQQRLRFTIFYIGVASFLFASKGQRPAFSALRNEYITCRGTTLEKLF